MTPERAALSILQKVTQEGAYANLALKDELAKLPERDAARTTALVYTAIEHMGYCDHLISHYARGRVHSVIRNILRIALTETFFMDTPDHAACSNAVSLTADIGKAKLKGFVNGVLRSILRDRDAGALPPLPEDTAERLAILSGYPAFMISEYVMRYGAAFAEALVTKRIAGTSLRPVYPFTAAELEEHLKKLGIDYIKSSYLEDSLVVSGIKGNIAEDLLFAEGRFTVQSEGAMLACRCLEPKPGMKVLDACAAPGGKTAYISDIMRREGEITAWDIHPHRVQLIKNTLARLHVTNAICSVRDASVFDPALEGRFDAVLLDVPCSGLGGGSKPDARMRRTEESIEEISRLQLSILETCSRYIKPGGTLVYSTCTVSYHENERVAEQFLRNNASFAAGDFGGAIPASLASRVNNGMLQLFPNLDDTEGFFIAKLKRTV